MNAAERDLEKRVEALEKLVEELVDAVNSLPTALNIDHIGVSLEDQVEYARRNS